MSSGAQSEMLCFCWNMVCLVFHFSEYSLHHRLWYSWSYIIYFFPNSLEQCRIPHLKQRGTERKTKQQRLQGKTERQIFLLCLIVCNRELLMMMGANEDVVINQGCNGCTDERAEPVNPVASPCPADHCRAEGDCRVHGGAIKRPASQDIRAHNETNCNGCNRAQIPLLWIHSRGVDSVHQPKGHHDLEYQRVPDWYTGWQSECWCFLQQKSRLVYVGDLEDLIHLSRMFETSWDFWGFLPVHQWQVSGGDKPQLIQAAELSSTRSPSKEWCCLPRMPQMSRRGSRGRRRCWRQPTPPRKAPRRGPTPPLSTLLELLLHHLSTYLVTKF